MKKKKMFGGGGNEDILITLPNLVSYYTLDNNTDDTHGSHNGLELGTVTYASGLSGNCLQTAGSSTTDYVTIPTSTVMGVNGSNSMSMFFKPSLVSWRTPFYAITRNQWLELSLGSDNKIRVYYNTDAGVKQQVHGDYVLNAWSHVVVSRDFTNNEARVYIDGIEGGGSPYSMSGTAMIASGGDMKIGRLYNGLIEGVGIWDEPFTPAQALKLYNHQITGGDL